MDIDDGDAQRNQHDGRKGHAALHVQILEAVERHVGHHGQPCIQREAEGQPGNLRPAQAHRSLAWAHASFGKQPDKPHDQRRGRRRRQSLEVTLVDHTGIDVEARQAQRSAGAIDKRGDPAPAPQPLQRPHVGDERGCGTERHHVGQRIHLLAERALGVGHARHAPIQAVEHHGAENANGCHVEAAVHRHDDGIEAAEQRRQRKQVGQDVNALAALAHHDALFFGGFIAVMHQIGLQPLPNKRKELHF